MKNQLILLLFLAAFPMLTFAQGKGKAKPKDSKPATIVVKNNNPGHDDIIWAGTKDLDGGRPKPSKNQPAKVRAAFTRDYPNVSNVRWSKYRGDWTATFTHGPFLSTAVYHANGDRRDTRTSLLRTQIPVNIIDIITKRLPGVNINVGVKIASPQFMKDIYRINAVVNGTPRYLYYNSEGEEVKYNY